MNILKKHNQILRKIGVISIIIMFCFIACEKNEFLKKPTVKTVRVENTTAVNTSAFGEIINLDDKPIVEFGFCWSESDNPTKSNNVFLIELDVANSNFNTIISGLEPSKTYYLRAFASNSVGTGYGDKVSFTTEDGNISIITTEITNLTATSVTSGGSISDDGGSEVFDRGVCYNTSQNPTINNDTIQDSNNGIGTFNCGIDGLLPGTIYYIKAFATNEAGTSYGNEINFTTEDGLPVVSTTIVSNITTTGATSGGDITDDGGFAITARGVCWSTAPSPTLVGDHTADESGTGNFQSNIEGLNIGTRYYLRAYATNENGTVVGEELVFFTDIVDYDDNEYDVVIIGDQTWMAENMKSTHYATGVILVDGNGVGDIWEDVITKYYFAYDDNDANVATYGRLYTWAAAMNCKEGDVTYSLGVQGICPDGWHMPNDLEWLELEMYLGMNQNEADNYGIRGTDQGNKLKSTSGWSLGGNGTNESGFSALPGGYRDGGGFNEIYNSAYFWSGVNDHDGGSLARRLVYDQGGIGRDGQSEGLSVRCIQGNSGPTVSINAVTNITKSSATVEYYVSSDGGEEVTENGVYYGTSTNPETTGTKLQIASSTGIFSTNISELIVGTTYYIKAYAVNNIGTAYGNEVSFSTYNTDAIIDFDGNYYNIVTIGNQKWMAENLKTTHYADGTPLVDGNGVGSITGDYTAKYYFAYNDDEYNVPIYGRLYTWAAIMNSEVSSNDNPSGVQGVCLDGWHLPSDAEWNELIDYLSNNGFSGFEGSALKSTYGWFNEGNGSDNFGFTALPGGIRDYNGTFDGSRHYGNWGSSRENSSTEIYFLRMYDDVSDVYVSNGNKAYGYSVRCLRD